MKLLSRLSGLLAAACVCAPGFAQESAQVRKPNILLIVADDLGYGDLGVQGQRVIATPNLDRLAAEGMRFTRGYAGSTVCAPSRCALMTGLHTGHALIRGNAQVPLRPEDVTMAEVLKSAGYATGLFGKWGLGEEGSTGVPNRQGFDSFFGFLNQHHAHNYYPDFLYRNEARIKLEGNVIGPVDNVATKRTVYAPDLFLKEALAFLEANRDRPFFLEFANTLPHANNERGRELGDGMEVPDYGPYADKPWKSPHKGHAAMIGRLDGDVGQLLDKLRALGLERDTLVIFTSDNGPHKEGGADPKFFQSSGPLRGYKRDLYEGGIRVPFLARWPGKVTAGATTSAPVAFWDLLPTFAEVAGVNAPDGLDGVSILPTILGKSGKIDRPPLYWEFHEGGFKQAAVMGDWKAVRVGLDRPLEIYDLAKDEGETRDLARERPEIVARFESHFQGARTESPHWPLKRGGRAAARTD
ncbi:MAG: arylsulfatase [Isosphaeraceae bacterium]